MPLYVILIEELHMQHFQSMAERLVSLDVKEESKLRVNLYKELIA